MTSQLNMYGDTLIRAAAGHGSDISSQRADELDELARARVNEIVTGQGGCRALDAACGLGGQAIRLAQDGARVIATDLHDFSPELASSAHRHGDW